MQLRVCQGMQRKCANKANKSKQITDGESHQSKTANPTFSYLKLNEQHVIPKNDIGSIKCHTVYQCCGMCSVLVCEEKHHRLNFISIHQRLYHRLSVSLPCIRRWLSLAGPKRTGVWTILGAFGPVAKSIF